jgi:amidophosphoribosyltransferase (EC 2.4.2.14)
VPRGDGRLSHDLLPGEKGPQDACGVFGVWAPGEDVAKLTYYGLYALQHRGQESAGIAASDGHRLLVYKDMGLVSQVFDERSLASLKGHLAVGHCRYSTTGGSTWENAQPTLGGHDDGTVALAHNGNLINSAELRDLVEERTGDGQHRRGAALRQHHGHGAGHGAPGRRPGPHVGGGRDGRAAAAGGAPSASSS